MVVEAGKLNVVVSVVARGGEAMSTPGGERKLSPKVKKMQAAISTFAGDSMCARCWYTKAGACRASQARRERPLGHIRKSRRISMEDYPIIHEI